MRCSTSLRVLAQLVLLSYLMAYQNVVYLLPKVLHEKLAKIPISVIRRWHAPSPDISLSMPGRACQDVSVLICD